MDPLNPQGESMDNYKGMRTVFICFSESNVCTYNTVLNEGDRFWFTILYFYLAENYIQSVEVIRITCYIFV